MIAWQFKCNRSSSIWGRIWLTWGGDIFLCGYSRNQSKHVEPNSLFFFETTPSASAKLAVQYRQGIRWYWLLWQTHVWGVLSSICGSGQHVRSSIHLYWCIWWIRCRRTIISTSAHCGPCDQRAARSNFHSAKLPNTSFWTGESCSHVPVAQTAGVCKWY